MQVLICRLSQFLVVKRINLDSKGEMINFAFEMQGRGKCCEEVLRGKRMEKDHNDSRDLRALVEERIVGGRAASSPPTIFRNLTLNRKSSSIQMQIDLQVETFLYLKLTISK